MTNLWNKSDLPHKGWTCLEVFDVRANGETSDKAKYETCEMCGNEKIRFVHIMSHAKHPEGLRVGCQCAEKMSGDYANPKEREKELRNCAARREKWLGRKWKTSRKGHPWLKSGDYVVVVCAEGLNPRRYRLFIGERRGQRLYDSENIAKLATFDAIEKMKLIKKSG
jgi:hypothetical protein